MKVLLGVTGGIAAYKSAEIIRLLTEAGHEVRVLPTENALRFIGSTTLEALSHNPIDPNLYTDVADVKHIEIAQWAEVVLVAPATASFLARTAAGIADDLLGNAVLATKAPVFVAPAMHTEMWDNAATRANVDILSSRGVTIIEPGIGRLTGSDTGVGRLAEPVEIVMAITASLRLAGKHVVVTAGGTREPIDGVRFVGNYSSGKQGIAIARAAALQGAKVTLIGANLEVVIGFSDFIPVSTAAELAQEVSRATQSADVLVMAAAVADFRIAEPSTTKLKRSELGDQLDLHLVANPDILAETNRQGLFKVGFAAETGAELGIVAMQKLATKKCQLIVANDVSGGAVFAKNNTKIEIFDSSGLVDSFEGSKAGAAQVIIEQVIERLA